MDFERNALPPSTLSLADGLTGRVIAICYGHLPSSCQMIIEGNRWLENVRNSENVIPTRRERGAVLKGGLPEVSGFTTLTIGIRRSAAQRGRRRAAVPRKSLTIVSHAAVSILPPRLTLMTS